MGERKNIPHQTCLFEKKSPQKVSRSMKFFMPASTLHTVPAPIKGAPNIQKILFWSSDCQIVFLHDS